MTILMLHFACRSRLADARAAQLEADACVIDETLEQAESLAREAILAHDYRVDELIAYSQIDEAQVATLGDYETALYLKAVQRKPKVAVVFS